ncbi:M20/M25/M40 family metallo-hydrolase [Hyalangium minutum]|uniref:Bacterial leucyl aminopeptidase n=1 Tax=Hyalangium minutum TaxID=394096 RepID=A0A085WFN8_9BACT|nr:M20/M25/M40 family metallo-hydrolase [Hyalangium minutum]KFE66501.1 Bacterial leucyl aminopeptidase [Hyalangium minutum]
MTLRKSVPIIACLACAAPAFAQAPQQGKLDKVQEKRVWITIGSDALPTVREAFTGQGLALATPLKEKGGVSALNIPESQIDQIAGVMHSKLNRCAGFKTFDSEAEALKEVDIANSPPPPSLLATSYFINNGPSVNAMLSGVQELNIRNTINSLSTNFTTRRYNVQAGADAANWLKSQWTTIANGRSDISVALFTHTWTQPSVIATITGTTLPNEVVVIGGHLDSINQSSSTGAAPGADDDASGVASLTEAFRVAVANGYKPARTVKFMAYAAEEVGLNGSAAIANSFKSAGTNVVGVLQLDMTNYKGSQYEFAMVTDNTNATLNNFTVSLINTYQPDLGGTKITNITCGYGCSDHASWTSAGYPSTMPFEATMTTDNPQIHTTGDTLTFMGGTANNSVKFAKLAVSFLGELAKGATTGNTPPPTDDGTPPTTCTPVTLSNGVTVSGISVAANAWTCAYTLAVPTGASNLTFNLSGGTGDADLYVKAGAEPTSTVYDCRSEVNGNTETCTIATPTAGTYYVKLLGYSAASGVSLKGSYTTGSSGNVLANGVETAPYGGATGAMTCYTLSVPSGKTSLVFNQVGKTGTTGDADLFVKQGSAPTTSSYTCRPYLSGSTETCTISSPAAGTWYACSRGYSTYTNVTMKGTYSP